MAGRLPEQRSGEPEPRSGDAAELVALFTATASALRVYAGSFVGRDLADDVLSETFLVVWRRWGELPEELDERRAWVFGVARLLARAIARRERRAGAGMRAALADAIAADVADSVVSRDRVARLLGALPDQSREAILLVVWAGLSAPQAAGVVGCSPTAMSTRLSRARRRLEELIAAEATVEQGVDRGR